MLNVITLTQRLASMMSCDVMVQSSNHIKPRLNFMFLLWICSVWGPFERIRLSINSILIFQIYHRWKESRKFNVKATNLKKKILGVGVGKSVSLIKNYLTKDIRTYKM